MHSTTIFLHLFISEDSVHNNGIPFDGTSCCSTHEAHPVSWSEREKHPATDIRILLLLLVAFLYLKNTRLLICSTLW